MTDAESPPPSKPPVAKVRIGSVTAAVWRNGEFYSATFERRYQDKEGQWQTSHSFGPSDLLALAKAADRAHDRILAFYEQEKRDAEAA